MDNNDTIDTVVGLQSTSTKGIITIHYEQLIKHFISILMTL